MRFLIDAGLSPRLAEALIDAGRDAVHVQTTISLDAADDAVFDHARLDQRVLVTADTDFSDLLAHRAAT
jgi:predicted nuclease of predicted toxin-antitoxin system